MTSDKQKHLRHKWVTQNNDSKPVTQEELFRILRRQSLVQRLRRRAMTLFVIGCTGPFWIYILTCIQPVSVLLRVIYISFMLINGLVSLYWWFRLGKVYQYMSIPMIEAQNKIEKLVRLNRRIKIYTWIVATPVIFLLIYEIALQGGEDELTGAFIGLAIGLTVGIIWEIRCRRALKAIKKTFNTPE